MLAGQPGYNRSVQSTFVIASTQVNIYDTAAQAGAAAADVAAVAIRKTVATSGAARLLVATGNSQLVLIDCLVAQSGIAWNAVDILHMDEYVALPATHPSSFRHWIRSRLVDRVSPRSVCYLNGDASDLDKEIARYSALLTAAPIDVAFVGFGENGHIAFNDPPVADFEDPAIVKRVQLDPLCRQQQFGEGHFPSLDTVPKEALTVTCTGLFRAKQWICCVPDSRKAAAVRCALEGPVTPRCPASLVRKHPNATVFLDHAAAAALTRTSRSQI